MNLVQMEGDKDVLPTDSLGHIRNDATGIANLPLNASVRHIAMHQPILELRKDLRSAPL